MATCRSCDAPIWWAITINGKTMPVDVDPTPDGNVVRTGRTGTSRQGTELPEVEVRAAEPQLFDVPEHTEPRFRSHFVTCPDAAAHRKAGA